MFALVALLQHQERGVIYSTIRTEDWLYVNPSAKLQEIYKNYIEQMGHYVFVFRHQFRTTEFYTIGDDTAQQLINTMMNCYAKDQTAIGDSRYTGLVVLDKKVLFPGSSTSMFSKQNCEADNIVASSIFTTAFGNLNEFELTTGDGANGHYFSHLTKDDSSTYNNINWNKVPRFIVSDGKQTLSILNVSQNLQGITNNNMLPDISIDFYSFFSFTYKNNKSWADYFSSNTNSPGNSSDLTAFNTEVQLGNERSLSLSDQNVAVTSVAVGDKAIVMVGKNNSNTILYLVK